MGLAIDQTKEECGQAHVAVGSVGPRLCVRRPRSSVGLILTPLPTTIHRETAGTVLCWRALRIFMCGSRHSCVCYQDTVVPCSVCV